MAYNSAVPSASNNWSADLTAMQANFNLLRQFFMDGVIPVDGVSMEYTYSSGRLTRVDFKGALSNGNTNNGQFTYNGADELTQEVWTVYGATITVEHTYSSEELTKTEITIT